MFTINEKPLSTILGPPGNRVIDAGLATPIWNMIQITVKEHQRSVVTGFMWDSIGVRIRVHIVDSVLASVRKKL
jgi:hypothetical protein